MPRNQHPACLADRPPPLNNRALRLRPIVVFLAAILLCYFALASTGNLTTYAYDALNRLTKTTTPNGKTATVVWNINGTKQSETDPSNNSLTYGYDAMARLNQVTQTNGTTNQITAYGFDNLGNKTSQTDAEGRITQWTYDAANRVASRTLPGGQTEIYQYDAVGNLTGKTDFAGKTTNYGVTPLGQINQVIRPDGAIIQSTYTPNGQIASQTVTGGNGIRNGKTQYSYDAQDRLTKQLNPDNSYLAYSYDANGNITQRSTPAGTVNYSYDINQRLQSVTDAQGKVTTYHYDNTGKPDVVTTPDGITAHSRYDDNGRLTQLLHTQGTRIVTGVKYTHADNGQRTKTDEYDSLSTLIDNVPANPIRTSDYQYDSAGRLITEKITDRTNTVIRTTTYGYDKVGNRKQKQETTASGTETIAYSYDTNDRLTSEAKTTPTGSLVTTSYTWDTNGNVQSKSQGTRTTTYGWSSDNHLIEVKQGTSQATATLIAKYTYDADGNRISKTEPTPQGDKVTRYLIDSTFPYAQTVSETTTQGSTSTATNYTWGNTLIAQSRGGQQTFYHADGLGSIKALTDSKGNVTDTYAYEAFGNVESQTGSTTNAYRYTGEYFDEATSLQFNRARWYDANIGRFVSQDTYAGAPKKPVTLNKYVYANSDAVNVVDPSGRFGLAELGAADAVAGVLNNIQINFGFDFISHALDGGSDSASSDGWAILTSVAPFAIGQLAKQSIKIVSKIGKKGKVAYSAKKAPLPKEIESAEFLSEHLGVGIYIRGGAATQGADFFISGVKWELKTLESPSNNAVARNIKKAIDRGQSSRIVIDGRKVGLTEAEALAGIARASRNGANPAELMILLTDGKILIWP